jgi:DNA adenine methylase
MGLAQSQPESTGAEQVDLRPPLKWAGGKRWLAPRLRAMWQGHIHRRLVEPFVGGLAVALELRPRRALLNDLNPHLVNFYQCLQRGLVAQVEMQNVERVYYCQRERFNALIRRGEHQTQEAASLFYYLNRTGYNGLCRFNRRGEFNVPFGRYRRIRYNTDFRAYAPLLAPWRFQCVDFCQLALRPDDWIYADPPYDVEFTSYSRHGFDWEDQVRLAEWLAGHPGPVIASNQATPRIQALYGRLGFEIALLEGPRRISCNGDRRPALEILATKGL